MCKSETRIFLNSGFMCCMKHVYCCTVQPSKDIQRRSALVSCGRWEMDFAFPSSQNIPEPWDPLQKYDGFACSFIMMSWWACNNRVPVRHNNNTHTHRVTLFNFQFILLFCLQLCSCLMLCDLKAFPTGQEQSHGLWHLWRALFPCWQSPFNVKLITCFWTVYGNKLDVK